jgi:16S rRNA (uracil1498-N3)-methyltransferase
VRISGRDYHYLVRVRRLAAGGFFPALLPGGVEARVRVLSVEGGVLTGVCEPAGNCADAPEPGPPVPAPRGPGPPLPPIVLFQALPKGSKMDLVVRQAAEGGLAEVVPFVSEHSAPPPAGGEKPRRWERIIREARQQSGSRAATALHRPLSADGLFEYWEDLKKGRPYPLKGGEAAGLFFHETPLADTGLHDYLGNNPGIVVFAVGPEGGFSSAEAARFKAAGFGSVTIGDTVLRTETAALYGAAAIRTILLERNLWMRSVNG